MIKVSDDISGTIDKSTIKVYLSAYKGEWLKVNDDIQKPGTNVCVVVEFTSRLGGMGFGTKLAYIGGIFRWTYTNHIVMSSRVSMSKKKSEYLEREIEDYLSLL